jgi:hypothetical protein
MSVAKVMHYTKTYGDDLRSMAEVFGNARVVWHGGPNYALVSDVPQGMALMINPELSDAAVIGEFGRSGEGWGGIVEVADGQSGPYMDQATQVEHDDFYVCLLLLKGKVYDQSE